jgi:hypothetical protein
MGYRSDVAYVIRFETAEQRDTFVELVKHRNDEHWTNAIEECETNYEQPIITFEASDVKWYDSYDDVRAHHAMMEWAVELYTGSGWRIVQLGEDGQEEIREGGDDVAELYDYIYTSHSLNAEFPAVKSTTTTEE